MPSLRRWRQSGAFKPTMSQAHKTELRGHVEDLNFDRCTVKGMAGVPRTYQVLGADVPCRFKQEEMGQAALLDPYGNPVQTYLVELPWNQTVAEENHIVHGDTVYEVIQVRDEHTPLLVKIARVKRIKTP